MCRDRCVRKRKKEWNAKTWRQEDMNEKRRTHVCEGEGWKGNQMEGRGRGRGRGRERERVSEWVSERVKEWETKKIQRPQEGKQKGRQGSWEGNKGKRSRIKNWTRNKGRAGFQKRQQRKTSPKKSVFNWNNVQRPQERTTKEDKDLRKETKQEWTKGLEKGSKGSQGP